MQADGYFVNGTDFTLRALPVRTLQDWEQGRCEPSGAAKTLLRIAARTPEAVSSDAVLSVAQRSLFAA